MLQFADEFDQLWRNEDEEEGVYQSLKNQSSANDSVIAVRLSLEFSLNSRNKDLDAGERTGQ